MSDKFIIKPGIYVVPNYGRIDCNKKVPQAEQVKLYLNPQFSQFITATPQGVALLKKEKPNEKQIASLLQRAKSVEEVNALLEIKSSKPLKNIATIKINSLGGNL
jgi:hypothetical protein